jgi:hypothetical protein
MTQGYTLDPWWNGGEAPHQLPRHLRDSTDIRGVVLVLSGSWDVLLL